MQALKDNWIWFVAPIVLFALIVVAIVVFGSDGQEYNAYELR